MDYAVELSCNALLTSVSKRRKELIGGPKHPFHESEIDFQAPGLHPCGRSYGAWPHGDRKRHPAERHRVTGTAPAWIMRCMA